MFQDRFREFLQEQKISSNSLAKKTGIPQTTISNWINRGSKPNIDDIEKICDYFNCSIDYLIGRENEEGVIIVNNSDNNYTIEEKNLIKLFRKLDQRQKASVFGLMVGLVS